jgi:hypothetical protein
MCVSPCVRKHRIAAIRAFGAACDFVAAADNELALAPSSSHASQIAGFR